MIGEYSGVTAAEQDEPAALTTAHTATAHPNHEMLAGRIEGERSRNLFLELWIPDLFMKRVEADAQWSLFCPNEVK